MPLLGRFISVSDGVALPLEGMRRVVGVVAASAGGDNGYKRRRLRESGCGWRKMNARIVSSRIMGKGNGKDMETTVVGGVIPALRELSVEVEVNDNEGL